ncbi:hypothetical protein GCM10028857_18650 [Salinarchaeum chitinilyticum]
MGAAGGGVIVPWRTRSGQMYISDQELLESLSTISPQTPKQMAEGRRRENVIRLQCRYLQDIGLVQAVARDLFEITEDGRQFVAESSELPTGSGYVLFEESLELPAGRITDFESLDPTVVKIINREFLEDSSNDYGWVREDRDLTESRIMNVKGYQLNRVMREFPRFVSLPRQCAHWMRAIVGLHFFPDANHRTGMATLYALLDANGVAPDNGSWPGSEIDKAVLYSKILRGLVTPVRFDTLWLCDELYQHWEQYFRRLFYDTDSYRPELSTDYLREVLDYAREKQNRL